MRRHQSTDSQGIGLGNMELSLRGQASDDNDLKKLVASSQARYIYIYLVDIKPSITAFEVRISQRIFPHFVSWISTESLP